MRSQELRARLAAVDWSSHHHAYGSASDVPEALVGFLSRDPDERGEADAWVLSAIWHQGSVYEATALVVPFLMALLADRRVPEPTALACELGLIAQAASDEEEGRCIRASRAAVALGLDTYLDRWSDADARLRSGLAFLLAHFPEHGSRILPHLRPSDTRLSAALTDTHPHDDAGAHCARCGAHWEALLDAIPEEPPPPVPVADLERELEALRTTGRSASGRSPRALAEVCLRAKQYELALRALALVAPDTADARQAPVTKALALAMFGRIEEARQIAEPLARGWLEPPTGPHSPSQEILRVDVLAMLAPFSDPELRALRERVRTAPEPEVWTSDDIESF